MKQIVKVLLLSVTVLIIAGCSKSQTNMSTDSQIVANIPGFGGFTQAEIDRLKDVRVIYFDYDSYNIASQDQRALAVQAWLLSKTSQNITVQGHADERGTPEYNIALGERRAIAVGSFFKGQGIAPSRVNIVSYGEEKPAALGSSEEAYSKNRRAVLVY